MGLFTPTAGTSSSTTSGTQTTTPDANTLNDWMQIKGGAFGLTAGPQGAMNNLPPQASVAGPSGLTSQYWNQAGGMATPPDLSGLSTFLGNLAGTVGQMGVNPYDIQFNQQYGPGALNFYNPFSGGVPQVSAPTGVSGLASYYQYNPQQVSAMSVNAPTVSAPGGVDPITGLMQVNAPNLQNYQMANVADVNAPQLKDFTMDAAANVAPSGLATTQSWTDPGTAAQYMDPYTQQVTDVQKQKAIEDWQAATEGQRSQAAAAGAYGGSRQAVQESTGQRDLQLQLAQIQATGLQNAYQSGMQQFNQQQQLGLQGQQFNIGTGLQAALSNQQMQQQANVQNLASYLQTQGLSSQEALQAALANQSAGLQVGQANLGANLQTQGLGAQLNMQGQLANQQQGLQAAIANQQMQEYLSGQKFQAGLANQQSGLQAALANAGYGMQAQQLNQQAGLTAGLNAQQLGLQGALANAGYGMQAGMANQAALQQALGMQYSGNLQGALQTQNLGMQGQQMGLQAAINQEQFRQQQQLNNLQMTGQMGNFGNQMAQLGLSQYGAGLQGLGALQQASLGQQGYYQQLADTGYANQMANFTTPFQALSYLAQIQSMAPYATTTTSNQTQSGTSMPAQGSIFGQVLGGALGAVGALGGGTGISKLLNFSAKGGPIKDPPTGLALVGGRYARGGRVRNGLGSLMRAA